MPPNTPLPPKVPSKENSSKLGNEPPQGPSMFGIWEVVWPNRPETLNPSFVRSTAEGLVSDDGLMYRARGNTNSLVVVGLKTWVKFAMISCEVVGATTFEGYGSVHGGVHQTPIGC